MTKTSTNLGVGTGSQPGRARLGAAALATAGVLFVLYPALRPFSDEASLDGALAFASSAWLLAHILAMVAFTLLPVGLLGLHSALRATAQERLAFWAVVVSVIGIGLTLPFYGGEAYGLNAIGQEALARQEAALLSQAAVVRGGPGLLLFVAGLLLLALGAILTAIALWRSGSPAKWGGVLYALALGLFLPQFFFPQAVRVGHGVLLAVGCLWIAAGLWRPARA